MTAHLDQCHREQPSLFDLPQQPQPSKQQPKQADQGKASRDETFREIVGGLSLQRKYVMDRIVVAGRTGVTLDELAEQMRVEPNKISGRITELKKQGLVIHTKARRMTRAGSTAAVIVAKEFANTMRNDR